MGKRKLFFRTLLFLTGFIALFFLISPFGFAEGVSNTVGSGALNGSNKAVLAISAVVAVGVSCMGSAYALAKIGSAALGAMSEKPEIGGRAIIFLGMAEGIAIYGLIVAIMILNKI